jgi:60 kDa SS-A/Ro ribonucleoprotein
VVAKIAVEAREQYKLRHVPLWLLVAIVDAGHKGAAVSDLIAKVIQRPDEMSELVALYWKAGKKPLTKQLKVGLAKAFSKFNEYQLAKFDKPGSVSLRDVMFLAHPKPIDEAREDLQKRLANKALVTPDTWETELSAGKDKAATFTRLINEKKLGPQAMLKNLRNMTQAGVEAKTIRFGLSNVKTERVLPFVFKCLEGKSIKGTTTVLLDVSGSMNKPLSEKSELTRLDAAKGLAMLLREECEHVNIFTFADEAEPVAVAARRGFALRDAVGRTRGGTFLGRAIDFCNKKVPSDRIIVLTDEESADAVGGPKGKGYMLNVSTYEHTVGTREWVRVSGWSEAIVDYIKALERAE